MICTQKQRLRAGITIWLQVPYWSASKVWGKQIYVLENHLRVGN
jgi:hypothetical protein